MMKSLKHAVTAALAVGGYLAVSMTANAASTVTLDPPANGNSELVVWFTDTNTNVTYARVLTQTVTSLFGYVSGSGTVGSVTTVNGDANFQVNLGADSALTSFLSTAAGLGQNVTWGITAGAQVAASGPGSTVLMATASNPGADASTTGLAKSNLSAFLAGWETDAGNINGQNQTAANVNATLNGIIGMPASNSGTNITYYGAGINQAGLALTASSTLYAITNPTGSVSTAFGVSFNVGNVALSGSGSLLELNFTGNGNSAVPLPAAIWLLGSGLVGLAGVGRRRAVRTAA